MGKEKKSPIKKLIYWLASHPLLKLVALILAVLLWFYVRGELSKGY